MPQISRLKSDTNLHGVPITAARLIVVDAAGDAYDLLGTPSGAVVLGPRPGDDGVFTRVRERCVPYVLSVITAVPIGAGASGDSVLEGILILATTTTAATATLAGFGDQAGVAGNILLTGSTSSDVWYPMRWLNSVGALIVTASVANKVVVSWSAR